MNFTEVPNTGGGTFFKWPTIGVSVTGRFDGLVNGNIFNGKQTVYAKFVQLDGVELKVNAPTVLARRLRDEFKSGEVLRVTYTHDEKGKQPMPTKMFKIERGEAAPLAAAPGQASTAAVATSAGNPSAVDEYGRLLALLYSSNPKGAAAIAGALESFPEAARLDKLKGVLAQQGVSA